MRPLAVRCLIVPKLLDLWLKHPAHVAGKAKAGIISLRKIAAESTTSEAFLPPGREVDAEFLAQATCCGWLQRSGHLRSSFCRQS